MTRLHAVAVALVIAVLTIPGAGSAWAEEVTFPGGAEGVSLAGTVLLPEGASAENPVPGVVLVTGSGPQDRDESLMGKKPFKVLAEGLVARGYAVLRYDDRGTESLGIGQSTGDYPSSTTSDFADDAAAAVAYLAGVEGVDAEKIVVCGHSTGGLVTAHLLGSGRAPAAAVLLASPSVLGAELLWRQTDEMLRLRQKAGALPMTVEQLEEMSGLQRDLLMAYVSDDEAKIREASLAAIKAQLRMQGQDPDALPEGTLDAVLPQATAPLEQTWMDYFLRYDPQRDLAKTNTPVLAVFGGKDVQVIPEQNVPPMSAALREAGNPNSMVVVMETSNHLFQDAQTGLPEEYAELPNEMKPALVKLVADWLDGVFLSNN